MENTQEILENLENLSQEEQAEVTRQLAEDYKTLQSSTTKGIGLIDQAITFYKNTSGDLEKLAELEQTNPEIAKIVLKKFYDGETIDEIKANIQQQEEETKVSSEVNEIIKSYTDQIPEELRDQFNEEFKDLTGEKKLTPNNVEKYIKASLGVVGSKFDSKVLEDAKLASAGGSANTPQKNNKEEHLKEQAKDLLKGSRY